MTEQRLQKVFAWLEVYFFFNQKWKKKPKQCPPQKKTQQINKKNPLTFHKKSKVFH